MSELRQQVFGHPRSRRQPGELTTGQVWSEDLARATVPLPGGAHATVLVNRSYFEPGARTCWHSHPAGQTLVVEHGLALVQERGGPVIAVNAGSGVVCPADVEHWHGAGPGITMTQLAVTPAPDGTHYADWGPPVTDEEYTRWDAIAPA